MREWAVDPESDGTLRLAVFEARMAVPSSTVPSKKATVPVIVKVVVAELSGATEAVRVSGAPGVSTPGMAVSVVTVAALEMVNATVATLEL